jgi:hypothetical protein
MLPCFRSFATTVSYLDLTQVQCFVSLVASFAEKLAFQELGACFVEELDAKMAKLAALLVSDEAD